MVATNICGVLGMAPGLYSFEVVPKSNLWTPALVYFPQFLEPATFLVPTANNVRIWSGTKRHNVYIKFSPKIYLALPKSQEADSRTDNRTNIRPSLQSILVLRRAR